MLAALQGISLDALDERASLLHRVDNKYLTGRGELAALIDRLAGDHDALEIDGRRSFAYRSVYFDSPDLRCFHDHVEGRRPRFKVRTRCYLDAGECQLEVKVKTEDDETDKRQADHPAAAPDRLDDDARRFVHESLREFRADPPDRLGAVLWTEFDRSTLAAYEGGTRVTIDLRLRLVTTDGREARAKDDLALVETKTQDGRSRADELLAELGWSAPRCRSTARGSRCCSPPTLRARPRRCAGTSPSGPRAPPSRRGRTPAAARVQARASWASRRARAFAASTSRSLGGAAVSSSPSSRREAWATASTARWKASAFACEGLL